MPTLPILETEQEIRSAIALLDPVVRDAARDLAVRVVNQRELAADESRLRMAFGEQCLFALARHGWKLKDARAFKAFLDGHAELVMSLTLSVLRLVTLLGRRRRWGWLRGAQPKLEVGLVLNLFSLGAPAGQWEAVGGL